MNTTISYKDSQAMKETLVVVTRKGQITVPAEIRQALGLKQGDKIAVSLAQGVQPQAQLRPVRSVADLTYGAAGPVDRPATIKELRELARETVVEEALAEEQRSTSDKV